VPIPEFGSMAFNVEIWAGLAVKEWALPKARTIEGVKARHRVEVWQTARGTPKRLTEIWWAASIPQGHETISKFVLDYIVAESRQLATEAEEQSPPILIDKGGDADPVDIRANAHAVGLKLLGEQYPQTFEALRLKQDNETLFRAYSADLWALHGTPDAGAFNQLAGDQKFTAWLNSALNNPGEVARWKWQLALGWILEGLHALDDKQLAAAMNSKTGEALKPSGWRKRATRLGLVSSRSPGAPEKHPVSLPKK